jgi:hypothetical protein
MMSTEELTRRYHSLVKFMGRQLKEWSTAFGCYYDCNIAFHRMLANELPRALVDIYAVALFLSAANTGASTSSQDLQIEVVLAEPTLEGYGDLLVFVATCEESLHNDVGIQRGDRSEFEKKLRREVPELADDIAVIIKVHDHAYMEDAWWSHHRTFTCPCDRSTDGINREFHRAWTDRHTEMAELLRERMERWAAWAEEHERRKRS